MDVKTKIYEKYEKLRSFPNYETLDIIIADIEEQSINEALKNYLISDSKHLSIGIYSKKNLQKLLAALLESLLFKLRIFQISVQTPTGQEISWRFSHLGTSISGPWDTIEEFLEYLILHSWTMLEGQDETGIYYYDIPRTLLVFVQDEQDAKDVEKALDHMVDEETKKYQKHNIVK